MSAADEEQAGLCARCAHGHTQRNARGSAFWRCLRADDDSSYPRYPPLPVTSCAGFERSELRCPSRPRPARSGG